MHRGAWWATVHGVEESDMTEWLSTKVSTPTSERTLEPPVASRSSTWSEAPWHYIASGTLRTVKTTRVITDRHHKYAPPAFFFCLKPFIHYDCAQCHQIVQFQIHKMVHFMLCVIHHNKKLLHKILTFIQSLIYIAGLEKVTFLHNKKKSSKAKYYRVHNLDNRNFSQEASSVTTSAVWESSLTAIISHVLIQSHLILLHFSDIAFFTNGNFIETLCCLLLVSFC